MKSGSAASSKREYEDDELENTRESKSIKTDESPLETQNHLKMIDIEALIKEVGTVDGHKLVSLLRSIGVGEEVEMYKKDYTTIIYIPTSLVSDTSAFQAQLQTLSTVGRTFEISIEGDSIKIDIQKLSEHYVSPIPSSIYIVDSSLSAVNLLQNLLQSIKRRIQNLTEVNSSEPSQKSSENFLLEHFFGEKDSEDAPQVTLENSRGILQGEMGVTSCDSKKPILGTFCVGPCVVAVTVYNTETKTGTLSHIDGITNIDQAVSLLCYYACNEPSSAKLEVNLAASMPASANDTLLAIEAAFKHQRDKSYPNLSVKDLHVKSRIALDTRNGEIILNVKAAQLDQGLDAPSRLKCRGLQADLFCLDSTKYDMHVNFDERPFQNVMRDESIQAAASSQEKTEEPTPILVAFSRKREQSSSREGSPSSKIVKVKDADNLISAEIQKSVSSDATSKKKLRPPAA